MNAIPTKGLSPAGSLPDSQRQPAADAAVRLTADDELSGFQSGDSGADPWSAESGAASRASVPSHLAGIEVRLSVEVGSHRLPLRDLMSVEPGQLFALDRLTSEPVDILVNGKPFGRGEVVAIGDRFGIRLTDLSDQG